MATALVLQGGQVNTISQLAPALVRSLSVSVLTSLACIVVARIASLTMPWTRPKRHITDQTPMHNIVQNFVQYWGLFQFVVIPVAISVYRAKAVMTTQSTNTVLAGFTAVIVAALVFPLRNNFDHLRDLEKRKDSYPSFRSISNHILFITIYVAVVALLLLFWLWASYLDFELESK